MSPAPKQWIGIDIGGTFTDLVAYDAVEGTLFVHKKATPASSRAEHILQGIVELTAAAGFRGEDVAFIGHGTTVATNALLTRDAPPIALLMTRGFGDVLVIRRQTRQNTFDYYADHPDPLVPRHHVFEVHERVGADGEILEPLDEDSLAQTAQLLAHEGFASIAVCLLHSYVEPRHEHAIASTLERLLPRSLVSLSSGLVPEFREYERTSTTVLNAFVRPVVVAYLEDLERGLRDLRIDSPLLVMQSNGGAISAATAKRHPVALIRSGPAAGVAGAAHVARQAGESAVITLDIGGTSADVSVFEGDGPAVLRDWEVHGFPVKWTALDVRSIGAGGGSIAWVDDGGLLKVGPRSAGAEPGPAAYGRGGHRATVTDAHVVLGRIGPDAMLGGAIQVKAERAFAAIGSLAETLGISVEETAAGVIEIVNAAIAQEIRYVCADKGRAARDFTLLAYGGAGPQHAGEVARELGIGRVLIPHRPGLLCAFGVLTSAPRADLSVTQLVGLEQGMDPLLRSVLLLRDRARQWLKEQAIPSRGTHERWTLDMRYRGQNYELAVAVDPDAFDARELRERFHARHEQAYGYRSPSAVVQVVTVRLTLMLDADHPEINVRPSGPDSVIPIAWRDVHFGREIGVRRAAIYSRGSMPPGAQIQGPAVLEQMDTTTLILPDQHGLVDEWGNTVLTFREASWS